MRKSAKNVDICPQFRRVRKKALRARESAKTPDFWPKSPPTGSGRKKVRQAPEDPAIFGPLADLGKNERKCPDFLDFGNLRKSAKNVDICPQFRRVRKKSLRARESAKTPDFWPKSPPTGSGRKKVRQAPEDPAIFGPLADLGKNERKCPDFLDFGNLRKSAKNVDICPQFRSVRKNSSRARQSAKILEFWPKSSPTGSAREKVRPAPEDPTIFGSVPDLRKNERNCPDFSNFGNLRKSAKNVDICPTNSQSPENIVPRPEIRENPGLLDRGRRQLVPGGKTSASARGSSHFWNFSRSWENWNTPPPLTKNGLRVASHFVYLEPKWLRYSLHYAETNDLSPKCIRAGRGWTPAKGAPTGCTLAAVEAGRRQRPFFRF